MLLINGSNDFDTTSINNGRMDSLRLKAVNILKEGVGGSAFEV